MGQNQSGMGPGGDGGDKKKKADKLRKAKLARGEELSDDEGWSD